MSSSPSHPRAAVIGAGVAGLACARALAEAGFPVRVFDKARGPGGRTATRRGEAGAFDHGAQYFTARDPSFAARVERWRAEGVVAAWDGRIVSLKDGAFAPSPARSERFVAVPRMSSLARHLSAGLDLCCGRRIARVDRQGAAWCITDEAGASEEADLVVVATPAAQAVPLLGPAPALARRAAEAELQPCLAVMVRFEEEIGDFDAAFVEDSPLAWIARDSAKPGREPGERWVLHASPGWSAEHLEEEPDAFAARLLEGLAAALGRPLPAVAHASGHRWRYARATGPLSVDHLFDAGLRIGACGDWCGGDRVEDAWRSGAALAARILAEPGP